MSKLLDLAAAQITWVPVLAQPTCHSFSTSPVADFPAPINKELRKGALCISKPDPAKPGWHGDTQLDL